MGKIQDQIEEATGEFARVLAEDGNHLRFSNGLYIYREGAWDLVTNTEQIDLDAILRECCLTTGTDYASRKNQIWTNIHAAVTDTGGRAFDNEPFVACLNGTIDLANRELVEWDKNHCTTRRLNIEFDPEADCPQWRAMVDRMLESKDRTPKQIKAMHRFLQQWLGINIVGPAAKKKIRPLRQALMIDGVSYTGKSTFADVVKKLFGQKRCISPALEDLGKQFGKAQLVNALALISDDGIAENTVGDPKVLKAMVTGETMTADRKFKEEITFSYDGAVLFTTNTLPTIADESNAIYNRFILVKMDKVFTKEDQKRDLNGLDAMEFLAKHNEFPGILNWALDGFEDAFEKKGFDVPKECHLAAHHFRMKNDPVYGFLNELVEPDSGYVVPSRVAHALLSDYAQENYHQKLSLKKAANALYRNIRDVVQTVTIEEEDAGVATNYVGVKFTKLGMSYFQAAKLRNLPGLADVKKPFEARV